MFYLFVDIHISLFFCPLSFEFRFKIEQQTSIWENFNLLPSLLPIPRSSHLSPRKHSFIKRSQNGCKNKNPRAVEALVEKIVFTVQISIVFSSFFFSFSPSFSSSSSLFFLFSLFFSRRVAAPCNFYHCLEILEGWILGKIDSFVIFFVNLATNFSFSKNHSLVMFSLFNRFFFLFPRNRR